MFGPSETTIKNWMALYESGGVEALTPTPPTPPPRAQSYAQTTRREAVITTRTEHPEWGTRRISDVLARAHGGDALMHDAAPGALLVLWLPLA